MTNGKNKLPNARCITKSSREEAEDGPEVRLDKKAERRTEEKKINEKEIVLEVMV